MERCSVDRSFAIPFDTFGCLMIESKHSRCTSLANRVARARANAPTTRNTCCVTASDAQMHARPEHKQSQRFFRSYFPAIVINNTHSTIPGHTASRKCSSRVWRAQPEAFNTITSHSGERSKMAGASWILLLFGLSKTIKSKAPLLFLFRRCATFQQCWFFFLVSLALGFHLDSPATRPTTLQINCIPSDK